MVTSLFFHFEKKKSNATSVSSFSKAILEKQLQTTKITGEILRSTVRTTDVITASNRMNTLVNCLIRVHNAMMRMLQ
jgi:hypothetical protein